MAHFRANRCSGPTNISPCTGPYGGLWRLHDHQETACGPALTEAFAEHLDGVMPRVRVDEEVARAALARLEQERPDLHIVVRLTDGERLTRREVGCRLGVTHRTVGKRRDLALRMLRDWCA